IRIGLAYVQNRLERYEVLLQKFIVTATHDLARLRAAFDRNDRGGISGAAHSLRGAAAVVGATAMESAAQSVENVIRQQFTSEELQRAIGALEAAHVALSSAVGILAAPTPAPH